jgi:hypothetical protein
MRQKKLEQPINIWVITSECGMCHRCSMLKEEGHRVTTSTTRKPALSLVTVNFIINILSFILNIADRYPSVIAPLIEHILR